MFVGQKALVYLISPSESGASVPISVPSRIVYREVSEERQRLRHDFAKIYYFYAVMRFYGDLNGFCTDFFDVRKMGSLVMHI